jgi:hypothetical protein
MTEEIMDADWDENSTIQMATFDTACDRADRAFAALQDAALRLLDL